VGPLRGLRIIEVGGVGPGPFCAMLLADLGADVIRIDRRGASSPNRFELMRRGRASLALDLKQPAAVELVLRLVERADGLQEGFRPGVMERLGLGPRECLARNPRLVYGRMTGWGQEGPLASVAGHDINYIALSGALASIGSTDGKPVPPLNLVGDFGGGGIYLAFGMVAAMLEAKTSGQGQVVDAAMLDGALSLMTMFFGYAAAGGWSSKRGDNIIDSGSHFYDVYECSDGEYVSIGPMEPQFYQLLREKLGLTGPEFDRQMDRAAWPQLKEKVQAIFKSRTRDEWRDLLEGTDVCFAPVLHLNEVADHPHVAARRCMVDIDGILQPAPAPRFSRTPPDNPAPPVDVGVGGTQALQRWGLSGGDIAALEAEGVI
jgi:alpha-methylacyl-CoA racemase